MRKAANLVSGVMLVAAACLFCAGQVFAAGNVLLPSEGTTFNLGLSPQKPAAAAPAPKSDNNMTPDATAGSTPAAAANSTPSTTSLPSLSNDSETDNGTQPVSASASSGTGPTGQTTATTTAGLGIPTTVVQGAASITYPNGQRPHDHMGIALGQKSVWGPQDINTVSTTLGVDPAQVASTCRLAVSGMVMASSQVYDFDTMGAQQGDAFYNGPINNLIVSVKAMCPTGRLPPYSGFITQQGNSFTVPLGGANCPQVMPNRPPQMMAVTYNGNGIADCQFQ